MITNNKEYITQEEFDKHLAVNTHLFSKNVFCTRLGFLQQFEVALNEKYNLGLEDIENPLKYYDVANNRYMVERL